MLTPAFGGINLEDIASPNAFIFSTSFARTARSRYGTTTSRERLPLTWQAFTAALK